MATKSPGGKTREKIVSAAMELFAKKGFDRTTVDEIVAKAALPRGGRSISTLRARTT
ncbi:TetR/AcrR family transcriptional regulator [Thermococcus peptonophilus]|uniref:TetR/AcrR family transcriptional regulator n=1 Tax=Thermococcus peptonophilus TaxID=53952 RepID=UPI000ADE1CFD